MPSTLADFRSVIRCCGLTAVLFTSLATAVAAPPRASGGGDPLEPPPVLDRPPGAVAFPRPLDVGWIHAKTQPSRYGESSST